MTATVQIDKLTGMSTIGYEKTTVELNTTTSYLIGRM